MSTRIPRPPLSRLFMLLIVFAAVIVIGTAAKAEPPPRTKGPIPISELTLEEIDKELENRKIPKDVREKVLKDEKERRDKEKNLISRKGVSLWLRI
mgnify:CR=1 FL=1